MSFSLTSDCINLDLFCTRQVQTGFGRTGTHFWGFQGHDVIPDMVTMAKGIGNGFPMGAVVTTPGEFFQWDLRLDGFKCSHKMCLHYYSHKVGTRREETEFGLPSSKQPLWGCFECNNRFSVYYSPLQPQWSQALCCRWKTEWMTWMDYSIEVHHL